MSGLFGVATTGSDCVEDLYYGTDYHSHLGERKAGIAVVGSNWHNEPHSIENSQFKTRFLEKVRNISGTKGIGVISDSDTQPILRQTKFGKYAIVMSGFIHNRQKLIQDTWNEGHALVLDNQGRENSIELIAKILHFERDIVRGINSAWSKIDGSASILILTEEGIYAARDKMGRTPLVIGSKDNRWAVASESFVFGNLEYKIERELGPGEIVLITGDGTKTLQKPLESCNICTFLWIYTGFPASCYEGINTETVRERCGHFLAKRDSVEADMVSGVPDSGLAHAIGYAQQRREIPYRRPLVKYTPGYGRSYIPPDENLRKRIARMKLVAIREIISGKKIILCEDSIVRGTQLSEFTVLKLKDSGAREIHIRPACPPLMYPCKFLLSTRTLGELATRKAIFDIEGTYEPNNLDEYLDNSSVKFAEMVKRITDQLGVTSIMYQRLDDMIEAIGLPRQKLCTFCWTGK